MYQERAKPLLIEHLPLSSLRLDPQNPRRHDARQIGQIARSIESFGFNVPILVDREIVMQLTQMGFSDRIRKFCARRRTTGPEPISSRDLTTPTPGLERTYSLRVIGASPPEPW
jgi:ParB-like nuclease domain